MVVGCCKLLFVYKSQESITQSTFTEALQLLVTTTVQSCIVVAVTRMGALLFAVSVVLLVVVSVVVRVVGYVMVARLVSGIVILIVLSIVLRMMLSMVSSVMIVVPSYHMVQLLAVVPVP